MTDFVARLESVSLHYGKTQALDDVSLSLPTGQMVGLIGPDGVGKSSLLSLVAGARQIQTGTVMVLGGDMGSSSHRDAVCPRIAYMPQGLGKNLYPSLTVEENLQFFGRLFGHDPAQRRHRIDALTRSTGLYPFLTRPAGKLSGGMKQKLGLCCALIHDPDLLILDEPTTGVDPLARSQFWDLIARIRCERPGMSVLVATAYMEEAERFDWLVAMYAGRILATETPAGLKSRTRSATLEAAFIALLPESRRRGHRPVELRPFVATEDGPLAIEARDLTMQFGDFVAVDHVSFQIRRGEIFGFLGSNGCGKSTTMKMLTGLLPPTQGEAWLFGKTIDSRDMQVRQRVGYMSQSFSLYAELSVKQNLVLHARLFSVPESEIPAKVEATATRFGLVEVLDSLPGVLPLGIRQRLSLAVAVVHGPELLILDEPTSGVDPIARDMFWQHMIDLARNDGVTLFISTHFMNEAERCDRISFMHAGRVLVSDTPQALVEQCGAANLEGAFIHYLQQASSSPTHTLQAEHPVHEPELVGAQPRSLPSGPAQGRFSVSRLLSCAHLESLQLQRDPVRRLLALIGTLILMLIMAYGISMDVEDLTYAVLDHDQTSLSRGYDLNMAGSRYFVERPPILDHADLDRRMRSGEIALAIEIPPGFARDLKRGEAVEIGAWIDGANPQRSETIRGYLQGMHQGWLVEQMHLEQGGNAASTSAFTIETRFRYNPDVKSLPAMVPAVIPLLLLMIPAMLTALAVVREKELGSILNFYVTPLRRSEFLLGKQLPYVVLGLFNFLLMAALAVTLFGVPVTGSFATLLLASFIYVVFATGFGLFASSFTRSQIAAMFLTMIGTILPAIQFAGLLNPVSSLEGPGALIGQVYPTTYYLLISRGVFSKTLDLADVWQALWPLALSVPFILVLSVALLRKQEH